jgi:hypothetical protein
MPEQFEPTRNRSLWMKGSLRAIASLALTLAMVIGGAGSALAASPAPSPSPSKAASSPKASTPSPSPSASPAVKPKVAAAAAPTHATPTVAAPINKALAKNRAVRTAATPILPGPSGCGAVGTTVNVNLYAAPGSFTLPNPDPLAPAVTVNYWGFNTVDAAGLAPGDPGTTLYMCQSDTLQLTLFNKLPVPDPATTKADQHLSIELPAAKGRPDTTGFPATAAGAVAIGNVLPAITGLAPGTYLYEAGPTPGGDRQLAMGLAGLLIVRPTNFGGPVDGYSAYGTKLSQFQDEYTLATTELSTEFGDLPLMRDVHEYNPNVYLVNGKPFDPKSPNLLGVGPNERVLLHEANLGLRDHSLTIAGHRQSLLAADSHQLTNPPASDFNNDLTTSWLTPGQVTDSFVTVDPKGQTGFTYPIYDAGFHFNNDTVGGLGGMLAELNVVTGVGGDPTGPATTKVAVSPLTNPGQTDLTNPASGQITVTGQLAASAVRAEWFIDNVGTPGSGCDGATHANRCITINADKSFTLIIPWDNAVGSPTDSFLTALKSDNAGAVDGDHVFWVHAQADPNPALGQTVGLWGIAAGDVQTVAVTGSAVFNVDLHNSPTNDHNPNNIDGSNNTVIWAGAMASLPDWNVLGAYACIDSKTITGTCSGADRIDLFTNPAPTDPSTSGTFFPIPDYANLTPYGVRYPAQDPACTPQATPGPPGGAGPPPNQPGGANVVSICGVIPPATLQGLAPGTHHVTVIAYEGNNFNGNPLDHTVVPPGWGVRDGAPADADLVIDRIGPTTTIKPLSPNNGYQNGPGNLGFLDSLQIVATIDDTASGKSAIANAEVFLIPAAVPAGLPAGTLASCSSTTPPDASLTGTGAFMVPAGGAWASGSKTDAYAYIPLPEIRACQEGTVTFWIHGQDVAGNWGPYTAVNMTLDKTSPTITLLTANTLAGTSTVTATANDNLGGAHGNIVGAEWFIGAPPLPGSGLPVVAFTPANPVTFSFIPGSGYFATPTDVSVRVLDVAGNWSAVKTVTVP